MYPSVHPPICLHISFRSSIQPPSCTSPIHLSTYPFIPLSSSFFSSIHSTDRPRINPPVSLYSRHASMFSIQSVCALNHPHVRPAIHPHIPTCMYSSFCPSIHPPVCLSSMTSIHLPIHTCTVFIHSFIHRCSYTSVHASTHKSGPSFICSINTYILS